MSLKLVQEFAAFLDNNRYDEASHLLAEDCDYHYFEGNYKGSKNIINIYLQNDLESKKIFDEMTYSSNVEEMSDGNYKINFTDKIRKGHLHHEFHSYQIIKCNSNLIVGIEHCDIPGEIDALRMFYSRARSQKIDLP